MYRTNSSDPATIEMFLPTGWIVISKSLPVQDKIISFSSLHAQFFGIFLFTMDPNLGIDKNGIDKPFNGSLSLAVFGYPPL